MSSRPIYQTNHIAGAGTRVIATHAAVLRYVTINSKGTLCTVYNNTAGSGDVVAIIDTSVSPMTLMYDVDTPSGLTIVTTGSGSDITVVTEGRDV